MSKTVDYLKSAGKVSFNIVRDHWDIAALTLALYNPETVSDITDSVNTTLNINGSPEVLENITMGIYILPIVGGTIQEVVGSYNQFRKVGGDLGTSLMYAGTTTLCRLIRNVFAVLAMDSMGADTHSILLVDASNSNPYLPPLLTAAFEGLMYIPRLLLDKSNIEIVQYLEDNNTNP